MYNLNRTTLYTVSVQFNYTPNASLINRFDLQGRRQLS